jgi:secondary thiamine-phosphate synthase enzyme
MFYRDVLELETKPGLPMDITADVQKLLDNCELRDGVCHLFLTATTAGITINENDRMLFEDFRRLYDELTSPERIYHHPENAHAHLRASLLGQNLNIPVSDGRLVLGTWQKILLWDFDTKPRNRKIILTMSF